MDFIMRSEAMAIINKGQPFNLDFVTADRRRGTGGDYTAVKGWMKLREDLPEEIRPGHYKKKHEPRGDRNNHQHKTFLIFNPANRSHPITIHYRLMQVINGKTIING